MAHVLNPIGIVHSDFKVPVGAPIQGRFVPDATGVVEVFDDYVDGLDDVEGFSHLWLIYLLHRAGDALLRPVPFLDVTARGVFATRNPRRPNKLGLAVVRLDRRDGNRLHVRDVDALDGSPVIDIKPYVPRFDSVPDASEGWYAGRLDPSDPSVREGHGSR